MLLSLILGIIGIKGDKDRRLAVIVTVISGLLVAMALTSAALDALIPRWN
jgi:hypothetical protein